MMPILYENFNTSNVSRPLALAHESFVTNSKTVSAHNSIFLIVTELLPFNTSSQQACGIVHLIPDKWKCNFVRMTPGCHDSIQFIDYMHFLFCTVDVERMWIHYLAIILLVFFNFFLIYHLNFVIVYRICFCFFFAGCADSRGHLFVYDFGCHRR